MGLVVPLLVRGDLGPWDSLPKLHSRFPKSEAREGRERRRKLRHCHHHRHGAKEERGRGGYE